MMLWASLRYALYFYLFFIVVIYLFPPPPKSPRFGPLRVLAIIVINNQSWGNSRTFGLGVWKAQNDNDPCHTLYSIAHVIVCCYKILSYKAVLMMALCDQVV